jgi:bacillithiol biosynthesis deacetylase BshB1
MEVVALASSRACFLFRRAAIIIQPSLGVFRHFSVFRRSPMLDALVVAPHPDDAELGMGGTIVRLIERGWRLGILDLTSGEPTPLGSVELRATETAAANDALGNPWRENLGLPNRSLEPTLVHRRAIATVFRQTRPRLLFAPYWEDAHPDHIAATKLVEDARFWSKLTKSDIPGEPFHPTRILYYFSVHLRIVERPALVMDISNQLETKVKALRCYRSQLVDNQPEGQPGVIEAVCDRTRFWGQLAGVRHAEPFASREPIGLAGLDQLLL